MAKPMSFIERQMWTFAVLASGFFLLHSFTGLLVFYILQMMSFATEMVYLLKFTRETKETSKNDQ